MYYSDKIESLKEIFGTDRVELSAGQLKVDDLRYPIVQDVIVLDESYTIDSNEFAEDIRFTFGQEWQNYNAITDENRTEFDGYFDLVDLNSLRDYRVCDLGCGNGRWSYFLSDKCRELVLVDFSDAIFVARKNLAKARNCLFFKCDIKKLPFRQNFANFLFCLGVLHHLPTDSLTETRQLQQWSSRLLVYLYYNLDNRPFYFRFLLTPITAIRRVVSQIRDPRFRSIFVRAANLLIYQPMILLGTVLKPLGLSGKIPLYEAYHGKSLKRVDQDVYDRFFTRIEQRVGRGQIMDLARHFTTVTISENAPYYHFLLIK